MTPREVREMTAPEYLALVENMNREIRAIQRQQRKKGKR